MNGGSSLLRMLSSRKWAELITGSHTCTPRVVRAMTSALVFASCAGTFINVPVAYAGGSHSGASFTAGNWKKSPMSSACKLPYATWETASCWDTSANLFACSSARPRLGQPTMLISSSTSTITSANATSCAWVGRNTKVPSFCIRFAILTLNPLWIVFPLMFTAATPDGASFSTARA